MTTDPHTWNKLVYLLPQDTTQAEYQQAGAVAYPTRSEIAFSADSAFSRGDNVASHKVIVYDVARWGGAAALESWVDAHYHYTPETVIQYRGFVPVAYELATDVSHWNGFVEWEKMREKMQGDGLE